MFGQNTIKRQVMTAVNDMIKVAETKYKETCKSIDEESKIKKQTAADTLVKNILTGGAIK